MSGQQEQFPLRELCEALGWQGGTVHQALEEVKRLRALVKKQEPQRIGTYYCCPNAVGTGKTICDECAQIQADYSSTPSFLKKQAP